MRTIAGGAASECVALEPLLAAHARGGGAEPEGERVAAHLARCGACRATAATLGLVARAGAGPALDLWPRLRARLAGDDAADVLEVRLPPFGWRAAAAVATVVASVLAAPEPSRFLAVVIGML